MKKLMVAIAAAAISFAGFADDTNNWFTAGFGSAASSSGGAWSPAPSSLTWGDGDVLVLEDVDAQDPVTFGATESKASTNDENTIVFDTTVLFQGFEELPAIDTDAKAGVCALTGGDYYVVAKVNGENAWVDTGIEATFGAAVNVKVTVANGKAVYSFGADSTESLDLVNAEFQEVCYSGNGSVSALSANDILMGVVIDVPKILGLTVSCDKVRAIPGSRVTLSFEADTKIPSIDSAVYIVGDDGTLTPESGEDVEALDPGAKIGTVLYLTFAEAYEAASEDYTETITLCAGQYLAVAGNVINKAVDIDLNGNVLTNNYALSIVADVSVFDEVGTGVLELDANISVDDSEAHLNLVALDPSAISGEGVLTGEAEVGGTLMFASDFGSPNANLARFGDIPLMLQIELWDDDEKVAVYVGYPDGVPARFVRYDDDYKEVAYAMIDRDEGSPYVDSFNSVQEAINMSDAVYLCFEIGSELSEDELTFNPSTVVYAATGEDDLVGVDLLPTGKVTFDGSCGDYGAWVYSGEPPPTYTLTFPLRNEGVHALVTNLTTGAFWNFDGPSTNSVVVEEGSFVTEILSSTKPGYEASGTTISWSNIKKDIEFPEFEARPIKYTITYHDANVTNGVFEYTIETETFALPKAADVEAMPGGQFKGWTNELGVAVNQVEKSTTGDLTFYAVWEAAGVFYPTYIDQDDADLKKKFNDWATNFNDGDRDGASANIDAFLLNCAPADVETAKTAFKIISITKTEDGWVCKVAGEKGEGAEYGNGYVHFVSVKEKFGSDGTSSDFFQATLTLENPATE